MIFRRLFRRRHHLSRVTPSDPEEREFLLSPHNLALLLTNNMETHRSKLGRLRAYWLGAVACMSGFLQGYDTGIVGGVLTLTSFMHDYRYTDAQQTRTNSLCVSLQQAGGFVACFLVWPITYRFGRKYSLVFSAFVFIIGAIIQTINTHSLGAFYAGRLIAGLGLGSATVIVPMYSSEMAPKELRGQIGCFFQLFFTFGIFTSYWCDYGVKAGIAESSRQWQIPIGLQIVPAALMGLGALTLKESVRWYTIRGRHDEAWDSLKWIRGTDGPAIQAEIEEIRAGIELESKQKSGFRFTELLQKHNFKLLSTAFIVFMAQQATGATAFAYYGPQYFAVLAGDDTERNLLLTAIFGAVKVFACLTFVTLLSERIKRRTAFIGGAAIMSATFISAAAVVKTHPPPTGDNPTISAASIATVALIYFFVMIYNGSWGPLPWPYVSEIFPTRIREPGVAVGVSSQWLWNFVFSLATPYMIEAMGWGTFLFWGITNFMIFVGTMIFMKETRGKSLERINAEWQGEEDVLQNKLRHNTESPPSPYLPALGANKVWD